MAVHPVRLDHRRGGLHRLEQRRRRAPRGGRGGGGGHRLGGRDLRVAGAPVDASALDAERAEDVVVEAVRALEQLVDRRRNAPDSAPWITRWS